MILVSMKILPLGIVFGPEFFELLDNFIVPANLLVDDKQHRVEGQHDPEDDSRYFGFHNGPLQVPDERTTKERGLYIWVSSPPGLVVSGTLCEGRDGVRPGLDRCPDCLIRVGREGDPVTAEVQHVEFAVGIVAPEGCTEMHHPLDRGQRYRYVRL